MSQKPFVSVIIPTKNEGKTIKACLESLKLQHTSYPYEIILVDTNSQDQTLTIAQKYKVRVIKENRPGKNIARQTGSCHAQGHIFAFTEADCVVPSNWVETIITKFNSNPSAVALTGIYTFIDTTPFYDLLARTVLPFSVYAFHAIHGHHSLRGTNFAVRKEVLEKVGGFHPRAREFDDVELSMRINKYGKILFIPEMKAKTLDRRLRNRIFKFIKEISISYYKTCIKKDLVSQPVYKDIR